MKKYVMPGVFLATILFGVQSCKPKDSDIRTAVETKLHENAETANAGVMVTDGVVTLDGVMATEQAKQAGETAAASVKGVDKVVNNIAVAAEPTVAPPPPAPVIIAADDSLTNSVKDAIKDHPAVTADVKDGVVTLTGTASKDELRKIMMTLSGLHPKKIDNKITIK